MANIDNRYVISIPDGRPAGAAMQYYNLPSTDNLNGAALLMGQVPSGNGMRVDWAMFKYVGEANSLQVKNTKELTDSDLKIFQEYVKAYGGCKCKKYFGVE